MVLRFERHPLGLRCYAARRRVHHGLLGLVLLVTGAVLMIDDRADFPWWLVIDLRDH